MAEFSMAKESLTMSMSMATPSSSSGSSSSAAVDDDFEDACSICLEPFSLHDPASVTTCKHEYHLHCILEWSQRSKECPICWQDLALKDSASQELLAAAGIERNARARRLSNNRTDYSHQYQESDSAYGSHWTDDSDFNERMMQHLAAMMSRARQAHRTGRQRSSERSPSPDFMFASRLSESTLHPNSPDECSSAYGSPGSSSPIASSSQRPISANPSSVNFAGSAPRRVPHQPSRPPQSQSPECTQRPKSSELLAFSESIKSKFSAASARYKDSISKGTQGFREKLLARNSSVKELSKGVQREMTSSIAGVARMIDRLDLKSKRNTQSGEALSHGGETSNFFSKGKGVLDHIIASSRENHVDTGDLSLHEKSQATRPISSHKDVSYTERGN
ncbi:E3 ubiquitin-protein ligase RHF1A-like [Chenopodium quinoa]|uniref:E3 ubiquitin-protein ligase RHF1A-like n=1 Tax=Chenopodium quinoa TaxID=63459 RepID=UPI000B78D47F|nr:E3 ubiquitin-protein ligase RHF1A-like [Chenopodium quinoa]